MVVTEQPFLHSDPALVRAPVQAWSGTDGQIRVTPGAAGRAGRRLSAHGFYRGDVRVLSRAVLRVDGAEPEPVGHRLVGSDRAVFTGVIATPNAPTPDPQLVLERHRELSDDALIETWVFRSALAEPAVLDVELELASDLAELSAIKSGRAAAPVPPARGSGPVWQDGGVRAWLSADGARLGSPPDEPVLRLVWQVAVPAGGEATLGWRLSTEDERATLVPPVRRPVASAFADRLRTVGEPQDQRWGRWLRRSAADLDALLLAPVDRPESAFLAAGAPWYFTLFGRDSIWAARLLLPVVPELALSTLQVLARHQGVREDPGSAEQPGKILHELRDRPVRLDGGRQGRPLELPPVYYGSTDSTLLWISLLAETWRAGADPVAIEALLPALQAALGWLRDSADADGDGFVEYLDAGGRGLSNQGWKDSADSIRFADGRQAQGAIALVEVQGYAHRAALDGAELLTAFELPGAADWREWAGALAERFRSSFWCADRLGRYPALALDGDKRRVDGVSSNIGHLLGTGLLEPDESAEVAARLRHPTMLSGFGVRTLSGDNAGYWPWSYHCGSVWAHDTAIVLDGLRRDGFEAQAAELATGLLGAADAFDGRLPELFAGDGTFPDQPPSAYPASCRPQAWAAAAVVPAALALGLL